MSENNYHFYFLYDLASIISFLSVVAIYQKCGYNKTKVIFIMLFKTNNLLKHINTQDDTAK